MKGVRNSGQKLTGAFPAINLWKMDADTERAS
jgi:hypothetical protein